MDDQENEENRHAKSSNGNLVETMEDIEAEIRRRLCHANESTAGDGDFLMQVEEVADEKTCADANLVQEDGTAVVETEAISTSMLEGPLKAQDIAETGFGSGDFVSFASCASELVTGLHSTLNLRNFERETEDSSQDEAESTTKIEAGEHSVISPLNIQTLIAVRRLNIGRILLIHGSQLSSNALQQKHS